MIARISVILFTIATNSGPPLEAQPGPYRPGAGYRSAAELARAVDSLARAYPTLVRVSEIARSPGGRPVSLIRLGAGTSVDDRPAILVVANLTGPHLVGSEIVLRSAARLAAGYGRDTATTRLLDRSTFYLVPRANPDGAEAMFGPVALERSGNDTKADDDRDDAEDEDAPNDLNGDGLITMMRVTDPAGPWMSDPLEPSLLRRANVAKGEVGRFQLYLEGGDDDRDDAFNEDGIGGTDIGRNFPHNFEWFASGTGSHPVSAAESRALADLFRNHLNIAVAYVIGPQDNLMKPWEFRRVPGIAGSPQGTSAGGPFTAALPDDESWYTEITRRFKAATGLSDPPPAADFQGDLVSFGYFGLGRLSFGSRGWWIPKVAADTSKAAPKPESPDPIADERNAFAWIKNNRPDAFVAWREVRVPGFEGKKVEVGGFAPGTFFNPPPAHLDSVAAKHAAFLATLGSALPAIALREVRVEALGGRVFRISAQVANEGFLPTMSAIGARVRWPRRVKVDLVTDTGQSISSGRSTQLLAPLSGSGSGQPLTWTVVGDPGSTVTLRAGSPIAGTATQTITLRAK